LVKLGPLGLFCRLEAEASQKNFLFALAAVALLWASGGGAREACSLT
jgi:hypothetical protein